MRNYFLITLLLSLSIISCQKEIEFNGDPEESYLVVNGLIESDTTIQISLSKSKPAIGEQNTGASEITTGAIVMLTDKTTGQVFSSSQANTEGYYSFSTSAVSGHSYEIKINHPDFLTCTSSTFVPTQIPIVSWDSTSLKDDNMNIQKEISVRFDDPSGSNFYAFKLFSIDHVTNLKESIFMIKDESNEFNFEGGNVLIFDDELFNNKSKTIKVKFFPSYYYDINSGNNLSEKSYKIELYNLSEEAYKYVVSTSKSIENNNDFFGEPVKVFTNIQNGLGIFGGMNKSSVIID